MSAGLPAVVSNATAPLFPFPEVDQENFLKEVFSKYTEGDDQTLLVTQRPHHWKSLSTSPRQESLSNTFLTRKTVECVSRIIFAELKKANSPISTDGWEFKMENGLWFAKFCEGKLHVYYHSPDQKQLSSRDIRLEYLQVLNVFEGRFYVLKKASGQYRSVIDHESHCLKKLGFPFQYEAVFHSKRLEPHTSVVIGDHPSLFDYVKAARTEGELYIKLESERKKEIDAFQEVIAKCNHEIESRLSKGNLTDERKLELQQIQKKHLDEVQKEIDKINAEREKYHLQTFSERSFYIHIDICTRLLNHIHHLHRQKLAHGPLRLADWVSPDGHRWQLANHHMTIHADLSPQEAISIRNRTPSSDITNAECNQMQDIESLKKMNIEQLIESAQRQNIFALGIIFYQLLSHSENAHPYGGKLHVLKDNQWVPTDQNSVNALFSNDNQASFKSGRLPNNPELIQLIKEMVAINPSERPTIDNVLQRWTRLAAPVSKMATFQSSLEPEEEYREKILANYRERLDKTLEFKHHSLYWNAIPNSGTFQWIQTPLTREKVTAIFGKIYAEIRNPHSPIHSTAWALREGNAMWLAKVENSKLKLYHFIDHTFILDEWNCGYGRILNVTKAQFSTYRFTQGPKAKVFINNEEDCLTRLGCKGLLPQHEANFLYQDDTGFTTKYPSSLKGYLVLARNHAIQSEKILHHHQNLVNGITKEGKALASKAASISSKPDLTAEERLELQKIDQQHTKLREQLLTEELGFALTSNVSNPVGLLREQHIKICGELLNYVNLLHSKNFACGKLNLEHWVNVDGKNWQLQHMYGAIHAHSDLKFAAEMAARHDLHYITKGEFDLIQNTSSLNAMSTEQHVDFAKRRDVFALGVSFYKLLSMNDLFHPYGPLIQFLCKDNQLVPLEGDAAPNTLVYTMMDDQNNFDEEPLTIHNYSPELIALIKKMVDVDPAKRPTLQQVLKEWPTYVFKPKPPSIPKPPKPKPINTISSV